MANFGALGTLGHAYRTLNAVETTVRIAVYEISLALRHADPESPQECTRKLRILSSLTDCSPRLRTMSLSQYFQAFTRISRIVRHSYGTAKVTT